MLHNQVISIYCIEKYKRIKARNFFFPRRILGDGHLMLKLELLVPLLLFVGYYRSVPTSLIMFDAKICSLKLAYALNTQ